MTKRMNPKVKNLTRAVASDDRTAHRERGRIGFYGCGDMQRLVRVGLRDVDHPPRHALTIECPCGREHEVKIMWRYRKRNEPENAEVFV